MFTYLKRRFSSTDLTNDDQGLNPSGLMRQTGIVHQPSKPVQDYQYLPEEQRRKPTPEELYTQQQARNNNNNIGQGTTQRTGGGMAFPSAPSSPARTTGFGFMGTLQGQLMKTRQLFSTEALNSIIGDSKTLGGTKDKGKILLVIDNPTTDWAKYLYKRKVILDEEIRVEQAQFSEISISAYGDKGCVITVQDTKGSRPQLRTFKPDYVLIRQGQGSTTQHYENLITGLMFGGVPCMNPIESVYNMRNRAWMYSHLLRLRNRLGINEFPLINRSFQTKCQPITPDFQLPITVCIGGDTARECEVRVENNMLFQSLMSLANTTQRYATTEPCIQSVCDIHIQKIGLFIKAFMRKPMANSSLSTPGSTILEQIPVSSKFKAWIDAVAGLFGGLDICAIKAVQDETGDYYIQDLYGSEFLLLGDGQEEDRARIAELVLQRMGQQLQSPTVQPTIKPLVCQTSTGLINSPPSASSALQCGITTTAPTLYSQTIQKAAYITPITSPESMDRDFSPPIQSPPQQVSQPAQQQQQRSEVDPWMPTTQPIQPPQQQTSQQQSFPLQRRLSRDKPAPPPPPQTHKLRDLNTQPQKQSCSSSNFENIHIAPNVFDPFSGPSTHKTTDSPKQNVFQPPVVSSLEGGNTSSLGVFSPTSSDSARTRQSSVGMNFGTEAFNPNQTLTGGTKDSFGKKTIQSTGGMSFDRDGFDHSFSGNKNKFEQSNTQHECMGFGGDSFSHSISTAKDSFDQTETSKDVHNKSRQSSTSSNSMRFDKTDNFGSSNTASGGISSSGNTTSSGFNYRQDVHNVTDDFSSMSLSKASEFGSTGSRGFDKSKQDPWSVQASDTPTQKHPIIAATTAVSRPNVPARQTSQLSSSGAVDEADDTMKNLRNTFAGIFGNI